MHLLNKIQKIRISLSGLDFKSLIIIFMMVLSSLLDMMSVYFIAKLVSMPNILSSIYIVGINFSNEFFLLVIFFVVTLKASINYSYNLILYRFSTELENKIRLQLFSKIGQMKYLDFIKYSSAELSYTTTELTKNYSNGYVVPLFRLFNEVILICVLFLFLCNVNMQISFFVLSACLFFLIIYKLLIKRNQISYGDISVQYSTYILNIVNVLVLGFKEIVTNGNIQFFNKRFSKFSEVLRDNQFNYLMKSVKPKINLEFGSVVFILICIFLFRFLTIENPLLILTSLVMVSLRIAPSISSLNALIIQIKFNYSSWAKIDHFLSNNDDLENRNFLNEYQPNFDITSLRIEDLYYSYPNRVIFDGANLCLEISDIYVFTGSSGSGKSTFFNMLSGLLPGKSKFYINNVLEGNISKYVSYCPQEPFIFDGSLLENLILKSNFESQEQKNHVDYVLDMLSLTDLVNALNDNYDSILSLNDMRLSGGQRQRIGLARAILLDKPILLLDEFSSSLDSVTTLNILLYLRELAKRKIVLIISHDPLVISSTPRKFVIKNGSIIESFL